MNGIPSLVVRWSVPGGIRERNVRTGIDRGLYEIARDPDVRNDDGLLGFSLASRTLIGDGHGPLPELSFDGPHSPMLPPHDPLSMAKTLISAPRIGRGEEARIRLLMRAIAATGNVGAARSPARATVVTATPWSEWSAMRTAGTFGDEWESIDPDRTIPDMLPRIVEAVLTGGNHGPSSDDRIVFRAMTVHVAPEDALDPMAVMRATADLQANPIRSLLP